MTEDEMVGWHHRLKGHEFKQTPGDNGTGKHGVLHSTGVTKGQTQSQRVGHNLSTEQQQRILVMDQIFDDISKMLSLIH